MLIFELHQITLNDALNVSFLKWNVIWLKISKFRQKLPNVRSRQKTFCRPSQEQLMHHPVKSVLRLENLENVDGGRTAATSVRSDFTVAAFYCEAHWDPYVTNVKFVSFRRRDAIRGVDSEGVRIQSTWDHGVNVKIPESNCNFRRKLKLWHKVGHDRGHGTLKTGRNVKKSHWSAFHSGDFRTALVTAAGNAGPEFFKRLSCVVGRQLRLLPALMWVTRSAICRILGVRMADENTLRLGYICSRANSRSPILGLND